ncbi:MAG: stage II sporulation protein D [Firmicutes bacterium]|nr:stage II sporulation protein D [Bacillota bacterium]
MTYSYRRHRHRRCFAPFFLLLPLLMLPFLGEGTTDAASTEPNGVASSSLAPLSGQTITLTLENGTVTELPLEDYIVGVTAAEMPSSFHPEALKAQSVIARTYALWKGECGNDRHPGTELCSDPGHCQAYYDETALRALWGDAYEEKIALMREAVHATTGEVLVYKDCLAETYYHSTCGGHTASALEVWGEEIPYLQSVSCSHDTHAPRYRETFTIGLSELPWLLGDGVSPCIAVAKGEKATHVPISEEKTESGRIQTVSYAGLLFDAKDFRTALGLNSANFTLEAKGDTLIVTTLGFGHGVGLCQYGADGMAKAGEDYKSILAHYYKNVSLTEY